MDTGFRPDPRNNRQQGHDPVSADINPAFRAIAPAQKKGIIMTFQIRQRAGRSLMPPSAMETRQ